MAEASAQNMKVIEPVLDLSPTFRGTASGSKVQSIFRSLFDGDRPLLFEDRIQMKLPSSGSKQSLSMPGAFPWHQDFCYWSSYSRSLISLFVYLDQSTEENGCVQLLAYSPEAGLLPHVASGDDTFPLKLEGDALADLSSKHSPVLTTGSAVTVVVFSAFTPHASFNNISRRPRRSFFLVCNSAADGDGYYKASEQEPVYPIGSHSLGRVPQDKIDCWSAWRCRAVARKLVLGEQLLHHPLRGFHFLVTF